MEDKSILTEQNFGNDARRQIKKLSAENKRLLHENEQLKNELHELQGKLPRNSHADKYHTPLQRRADSEYMYSKRNYLSFSLARLKHTSLFSIYRRVIALFRRYSFITTSLKVFSVIFLFVEATLLVLVSTSAFIASITFTLLLSQIFMLFTAFSRRKHNEKNTELMRDKNITVFFPPRERAFDYDSFLCGFARDQAGRDNSAVVIVSPYSINSLGLERSKKSYFICRKDGKNIILVRKSYYFSLKRNVLDKVSASVTEIY